MSADDQAFLDVLSSLPFDVKRYSGEVADYIDQHVDKIAGTVRETLANATWIPQTVRSHLPAHESAPSVIPAVPLSVYERANGWFERNKIWLSILAFSTGTIVFRSFRRNQYLRKPRKARRARNGGRIDVIVIAGSPALPVTRAVALDMERKGFIVYIVCSTVEEEGMVQGLSRPDIRPLGLDISDPTSAGASIDSFAHYLQTPHAAVPRGKGNYLSLRSVILIPSLSYRTAPIATIAPTSFSDLFNTHLLNPIVTLQAFLPLLTARMSLPGPDKQQTSQAPQPNPQNDPTKVVVFTPSIISSINPPFHAPEATVCSALSAFTQVLTAELGPLSIPVTHMQLGTFDFSSFTATQQERFAVVGSSSSLATGGPRSANPHNGSVGVNPGPARAEALTWPESARHAYGRNFVATASSAISAGRIRGLRGSSLRDLHNALFDVIDGSDTRAIVRVGLGADAYGFVGRWAPRSIVSWMMGVRRVNDLATWQSATPTSSFGSPRSRSRPGSDNGDYVAVQSDGLGDAHVWKEG